MVISEAQKSRSFMLLLAFFILFLYFSLEIARKKFLMTRIENRCLKSFSFLLLVLHIKVKTEEKNFSLLLMLKNCQNITIIIIITTNEKNYMYIIFYIMIRWTIWRRLIEKCKTIVFQFPFRASAKKKRGSDEREKKPEIYHHHFYFCKIKTSLIIF